MAISNVATIDSAAGHLTLVNVYETEPETQGELVKMLSKVTVNSIRNQPGFVSVCIHSSLDGRKVVNYVQWESKSHFENFMRMRESQDQLRVFAGLSKSVSVNICMVNAVHTK